MDDNGGDFVEFTADGRFEQTSRSAEVKKDEGWQPLRIEVRRDDRIVADALLGS